MKENTRYVQVDLGGTQVEIVLDRTYRTSENKESRSQNSALLLHYHSYFEFFFVGAEELKIVTEEGEETIRNAVAVLPPGLNHYSISGANTYRFLAKVNADKGGFGERLFNILKEKSVHRILKGEELIFYLGQIERCMASESEMSEMKLSSLLSLTLFSLADLLHLSLKAKKNDSTKSGEYLIAIDNAISEAFTEKIDLSYVASKLYLSKKQVARIIKKAYGTTLSELINEKRLSAAAMLLASTKKPVSEIIAELNFPTQSYFFVQFKKRFGKTPLAYRNASQD